MKDIYKKILKEYPNWKIEYSDDSISLKQDGFTINASKDIVSIFKRYNKLLYLDEHCHPEEPNDVYESIVYYINNKDKLLKKQKKKDIIWIIVLITLVLVLILNAIMK